MGFESAQDETSETNATSLFTKFSKFAENYLQISPLARTNIDEEVIDVFCEKCELSLINPICQVYLELLSAQLRLSWEMGQLGKLIKNSQGPTSDKLRVSNIKTLKERLGIGNVAQLEEFRRLVAQKCQLKRKEMLPDVIVSRCSDVKVCVKTELNYDDVDDDDDSGHLDFGTEIDTRTDADPLDLQGFTDTPESKATMIKIENGVEIKNEPVVHDPNSELSPERNIKVKEAVADLQQNPASKVSNSNRKRKPNLFDNRKSPKLNCLKCNVELSSSSEIPKHNLYHHELMKCSFCGKSFEGKKNLSYHYHRHHYKVGSFPCQDCSKVYTTSNKLRVHRNKYHKNVSRKKCPYCDLTCLTDSCLAEHVAAIHKPENHPCPHCPRTVFTTLKYLKKHLLKCPRIDQGRQGQKP
ncbi:putative zinc finger protein [Orchesella cincta]|uniref:Putative zinc finger protein n=1 Tax=Orchesella cincta TaxID=48709 RepID=A0A1D2MK24_ORCCI|nr:putative zinc finger protein [Orchesella cincta]